MKRAHLLRGKECVGVSRHFLLRFCNRNTARSARSVAKPLARCPACGDRGRDGVLVSVAFPLKMFWELYWWCLGRIKNSDRQF